MSARYAIYYTPLRGSLLEELGQVWLGRTAADPHTQHLVAPEGFYLEEYQALVQAPRWYGFHGTLKAPFELAEGVTPKELESATAAVCRTHAPFMLSGLGGALGVGYFGTFFALTPAVHSPELGRLSADCVRQLDRLRAPLSLHDMKRHKQKNLSERQERLLHRFGYPFVLEEFRFHMTLTGVVEEKARPEYKARLEALLQPYLEPVVPVQEVTICMQPDRKSPFVEYTRIPLSGR